MKFDRFMIAPLGEGQINAVKPFLIPDQAFESMRNAYVFRQRVKKRFGSKWLGNTQSTTRLRAALVPVGLVVTTTENVAVGQMFSIGNDYFTVTNITPPYPVNLLSTSAVTAQLTAANQVTFSAIAGTVYWYPALPVMGLLQYEQSALNNEVTVAFDTRYSYKYNTGLGGWERLTLGGAAAIWSGTNSDFFWGTTWRGTEGDERFLFVTNYTATDGLRYLNLSTWNAFAPITLNDGTTTITIVSARLIVVFKNHLILLNTLESWSVLPGPVVTPRTFVNRARWSRVGNPLGADAFRTDIPGRGGGADAATSEAIVSCEFLRDRLIVFFERSTWELAYTGNQARPFTWQKINTEYGSESTFSVIPFDKVILGIANVGVMACNGSNVERIDQKIPDEVFKIRDGNQGVFRVYGIRDYISQMVYWAYPDQTNPDFPNRVFVYNYELNAWAFNDDSITCFGYHQPTTGVTWDSTVTTWDMAVSWDAPQLQPLFRKIIAGNQEGFTFFVDPEEAAFNSSNLQITNMTTAGILTVINHNFLAGQWVWIQDASGIVEFNNLIFKIQSITDSNTIVLDTRGIAGTGIYRGGGTLASVSQIDIKTKQYNFYADQGRNAYVQKVDFMVDRVNGAQIAVDYYASSSSQGLLAGAAISGALLGTGALALGPYALYPQEANQTRLWHPVYLNAEGEVVQLRIHYSEEQMIDANTSRQPFVLHSLLLTAAPTSRLQ